MLKLNVLAVALLSLTAARAQSQITVDIYEEGNDLVISSEGGSLDIASLTYATSFPNESEFDYGIVGFIGYYNTDVDAYTGDITTIKTPGWTQGTSFAPLDDGSTPASVLAAEFYSFLASPTLLVSTGFTSGGTIPPIEGGVSSFSLDDASLTQGESIRYEWSSTRGTESLTFNIIPEPSSSVLLVLATAAQLSLIRQSKASRTRQVG